MSERSWDDLCDGLRKVVFKRSADEVAEEIPAHRATVYRIIGGGVKRPSRAVREGVRRVVESETT